MAEALAEAGADIIGVSATLEAAGQRDRRPSSSATAARFEARAVDFADRAAVVALGEELARARRSTSSSTTPAPSSGHRPPSIRSSCGTACSRSNLSSQFVLTQAVGRPHARARSRQDHLHREPAQLPGRHQRARATPRRSPASPASPRPSPTSGQPAASPSTRIAPGYIATDNTQALQDDPDRSRAILDRIPAGRWGDADDLAGATVFLAAPASDYVSGIILPVDGGWLGR